MTDDLDLRTSPLTCNSASKIHAPPSFDHANPTYSMVMAAYEVSGKGSTRLTFSRKNLDPVFHERTICQLRRIDIRKYINSRLALGISPGTINRELDDFSAAINAWAFVYEVALVNPCLGMNLPTPEGRVRWITRAEAERLISVANPLGSAPHLGAFIQLALHTGCRKSELLGLERTRIRQDPHSAQHWLVLESKHTKTKKQRLIPLNKSALGALKLMEAWREEHCPSSPWVFPSPRNYDKPIWKLDNRFKKACDRAVIPDFRIHDLRHTFASWLVMAGQPLQVVRDLLGHTTIKMTERYAHLAPEHTVSAVAYLEAILPSQFDDAVFF